jgi:hypothetical protein
MGNGASGNRKDGVRAHSIKPSRTIDDPSPHRRTESPWLELDCRLEVRRFKASYSTDAVDDELVLDLELSGDTHVLPLAGAAPAIDFRAHRFDSKW